MLCVTRSGGVSEGPCQSHWLGHMFTSCAVLGWLGWADLQSAQGNSVFASGMLLALFFLTVFPGPRFLVPGCCVSRTAF